MRAGDEARVSRHSSQGLVEGKLAEKLAAKLAPFPPGDVISISYAVDIAFGWPFRRNSALVVLRTLDDE
jgi:hypothetical protein